jgi:hypothetical protein
MGLFMAKTSDPKKQDEKQENLEEKKRLFSHSLENNGSFCLFSMRERDFIPTSAIQPLWA